MKTSPTNLRRLGAGVATGALVASGLLLVGSPAQAADTETVTNADIAPDESTYAGWHQGADDASGRFGVSSKGLKQVGKSQIIHGYDDNSNTNLRSGGVNADVSDLIGAEYDVTAGQAYFQVPLFIDTDGSNSTEGVFATLRPVEGATSSTTIDGDDLWTVSKNIPGVAANAPTPLSDLVAAVDDRNYKTIGFGTFTDAGESATITSITFDGTTYAFTGDETATSTVANADVKGVETDENYTSWHQGYENARARQVVGANGLELDGKSQVIQGFSNNSTDLDAVNASLASVLDDASYTVGEVDGDVSFQIPLRSDAVAGNQFTTLYATIGGSGQHNLEDVSWQANKAIGSIPANTQKPIADFVVALGTYKVIGYGVLTDAGTSAVVSNVTFAGKSFDFVDAGPEATSTTVKEIAPNEDTYAGWHQGATTNTATIDDKLLKLGADRSQVINGYADDSQDVDLNVALRSAAYTVVDGAVFFQVPILVENGSSTPDFATLRPTDAAGEGIHKITLDDEWTSSRAIPNVIGANESARLGDILDKLDTDKVLGFGVYSDAGGNGVVRDITWDGVKYSFSDAVLTADDVTASTTSGKAVTVTLKGEISDGSPLTYSTTVAGAVVTGDKLKFTPAKTFVGSKSIAYTVTDEDGNTETANVKVTVRAVSNTKFSISPKAPTTKSTVKLKIQVVAKGATLKGSTALIYDGSKKLGSGKLSSTGTLTYTVGKLKKGTHKLKVSFRETPTATADYQVHVVKIKK